MASCLVRERVVPKIRLMWVGAEVQGAGGVRVGEFPGDQFEDLDLAPDLRLTR
jgi:hypothetical protein